MNQITRHDGGQSIPQSKAATFSMIGQGTVPAWPTHNIPFPATNANTSNGWVDMPIAGDQSDHNLDMPLMGILELRSFDGCTHYSDKEATAVLDSLHTLAQILLDTFVFTPAIKEAA